MPNRALGKELAKMVTRMNEHGLYGQVAFARMSIDRVDEGFPNLQTNVRTRWIRFGSLEEKLSICTANLQLDDASIFEAWHLAGKGLERNSVDVDVLPVSHP